MAVSSVLEIQHPRLEKGSCGFSLRARSVVGTVPALDVFVLRTANEETSMKDLILCAVVSLTLTASVASAEEIRVGVGVGWDVSDHPPLAREEAASGGLFYMFVSLPPCG
jgi:hypothetical protein